MASKYLKLGVSADKPEVHAALSMLEATAAPGAFCQVLASGADSFSAVHADGAGTKSIIAYLHYRETGDASIFEGVAVDSAVMNLDDLICIGATTEFLLSNTIGRNPHVVGGDVLKSIFKGYRDFCERMKALEVDVRMCGGETADVGDLVRTVIVDSTVHTVVSADRFIDAQNIAPGQAIVGLASFGRSTYEDTENSGIGSNGFTVARHVLLSDYYASRYPETFDPALPTSEVYADPYRLDDKIPKTNMTVGAALLSPTRTFAPVLRRILEELHSEISGVIHCSGGGLTKCRRFGSGVHYIKDNLFPLPAVFRSIQEAGELSNREMWNVFNCGHRLEVFCNHSVVDRIVAIANSFRIDAKRVGRTERAVGQNTLTIVDSGSEEHY